MPALTLALASAKYARLDRRPGHKLAKRRL